VIGNQASHITSTLRHASLPGGDWIATD